MKTTPSYRDEFLSPWPSHPPALLKGAPGQRWRMRECGLSMEHHPWPCRVEHTHRGSAGQCRWPPDGTARCPPGTGPWGARPPPGTGSHHRRSPACTHSAARSAAQGKGGNRVSANADASWGSLDPWEDGDEPSECLYSLLELWQSCERPHGLSCPHPLSHIESLARAVCLSWALRHVARDSCTTPCSQSHLLACGDQLWFLCKNGQHCPWRTIQEPLKQPRNDTTDSAFAP